MEDSISKRIKMWERSEKGQTTAYLHLVILKKEWKCYQERLLKSEETQEKESLLNVYPTKTPAIQVDRTKIDKGINVIKTGKASDSSGITTKMLEISGKVG